MLDNEVRKVRKEIVDLRNEILFALLENKSLLKQILEERILVNDIKNNIEAVRVEEEKPVIKKDLPDIPDKEVKIVKPILTQEAVKELFEYNNLSYPLFHKTTPKLLNVLITSFLYLS